MLGGVHPGEISASWKLCSEQAFLRRPLTNQEATLCKEIPTTDSWKMKSWLNQVLHEDFAVNLGIAVHPYSMVPKGLETKTHFVMLNFVFVFFLPQFGISFSDSLFNSYLDVAF